MKSINEITSEVAVRVLMASSTGNGDLSHQIVAEAIPNITLQEELAIIMNILKLGNIGGPVFLVGFVSGCLYTQELQKNKEVSELERLAKENG